MPCLKAADVPDLVRRGGSARIPLDIAAKFGIGERVRARILNPLGHTRLPRYLRGHIGIIESDHGVFSFPDSSAAGSGPKPQHLYLVRFESKELWGDADSFQGVVVYGDLWDDYLDPA